MRQQTITCTLKRKPLFGYLLATKEALAKQSEIYGPVLISICVGLV